MSYPLRIHSRVKQCLKQPKRQSHQHQVDKDVQNRKKAEILLILLAFHSSSNQYCSRKAPLQLGITLETLVSFKATNWQMPKIRALRFRHHKIDQRNPGDKWMDKLALWPLLDFKPQNLKFHNLSSPQLTLPQSKATGLGLKFRKPWNRLQ